MTHSGAGLRRLAASLSVLAVAVGAPAGASAAFTLDPSAVVLAVEIVPSPTLVTGAAYVSKPPVGGSVALSTDPLGSFPTKDDGYAILTTGNAALAPTPNNSGGSGADIGGPNVRGNSDYDVTILRIDLDVPANTNCLVGLDFRFLSDEYPEYVGSAYNDAFIAELDQSTWTTNGSEIVAPRNFAFDPEGNPISINAAGVTSMTAEHAAGTTYDGATPLLTAATPITPGPHSLYLSIFDQGDHILDSAVFVDNLRLGFVADVPNDCKPGADLADEKIVVGLGDSYSSGYGMEPFFPGTHKDGTENDCQRSELAFAPLVAALIGKELDFHACQGAVTADFYNQRENGAWGEEDQLDYIDDDTGLVTFSIGGNDAHFADTFRACIIGSFGEVLLPFNTCHGEDSVTEPIAEAFARLDGLSATPVETTPYDTLLKDIRGRSPYASRVQVGYPPFFTAEGSDRTWLPGGRCEGVKKADQRWMVEQITELNAIIARNTARNGFLFANPTGRFAGHEFCGEDDEWFFPVFTDGQVHPNAPGHEAIAAEIITELDASGDLPSLVVGPGQTHIYTFTAAGGLELLSVIIEWPGSDIELTLVSPSGKEYTRAAPGPGVYHANGPTWEQFQIPSPEPGQWTARLYGADVKPGGEKAVIRVAQEKPRNQHPIGAIELRREGGNLVLDASGSTDPDGEVVGWDWYFEQTDSDLVLQGETVSIPAVTAPQSITLVVTDDGGLTDFVTISTVPVDVKPGSDVNPINVGAKGVIPVALLSTEVFDATTIDPTTLRLGPGQAPTAPNGVHSEDVNGDGRLDLMLQFGNQATAVTAGMTTLCLDGTLPDGRPFQACDLIKTV